MFCIIYLIYPNSIANLCVVFLLKAYKLFISTEAWVVGGMGSRQNKIFMFKLTVESLPRTPALPPLSSSSSSTPLSPSFTMPSCNDGDDTSYGSGSDSGSLLSDFDYCRTNVSSFYSTCWFMGLGI